MSEENLDRTLDIVSAGMVEGEPSPALGRAVMARVRGLEERAPAGRLLWATAAAGVALSVAIAIVVLNRTPAQTIPAPAGPPPVVSAHPVPTLPLTASTAEVAPPGVMTVTRRIPSSVPDEGLLWSIEPIAFEPLVVPSIDLQPLVSEAASIDPIEIEPLTIEPLSASND